jgi:hypothetical protein
MIELLSRDLEHDLNELLEAGRRLVEFDRLFPLAESGPMPLNETVAKVRDAIDTDRTLRLVQLAEKLKWSGS